MHAHKRRSTHTFTHSSWLPALCSPAGARAIRLALFMQPSLSCPSAAAHSASITAPAGRHRPTGGEGRASTHALDDKGGTAGGEGGGGIGRVFLLCISVCFHRKQLAFCLCRCCPSALPPTFLFSLSDELYMKLGWIQGKERTARCETG